MPTSRALKVVDPNTQPAKKAPLTVSQAADKGSARELLVATRSSLAKFVDDPSTTATAVAAITRQMLLIDKEIRGIDATAKQEADRGDEVTDEAFDYDAI